MKIKLMIDVIINDAEKMYDTIWEEEFPTVAEAISSLPNRWAGYDLHRLAEIKFAILVIENGGLTKEHTLMTQDYDRTTQQWKPVEVYDLDLSQPDQEY